MKPTNEFTSGLFGSAPDISLRSFEPQDLILHDPSVPGEQVGTFISPSNSYEKAFDPANKATFSPNSSSSSVTPGLTLVRTDYGARTGVTSIEPLIPSYGAASATLPKQKFPPLLILAAVGAAIYFVARKRGH